MNDYFNPSGAPSTRSAGTSATMRAELVLVQAGFDKMPALAGNGLKTIRVNSGGTALEAAATTGTGAPVNQTSPTLVTPNIGAAIATSINGVGYTGVGGKTLTVNKSLTLDGTDSVTLTFPSTNATIARTDAAQTFTGTQTFATGIALQAVQAPTLLNSWTQSGVYATVGYYKDAYGVVHLQGTVDSGTNGLLFALPAGYRPTGDIEFPASNLISNDNFAIAIVASSGNVVISNFFGLGTRPSVVHLDGISFRTT